MLMMTCERANAIMCGGVLPDVTETEALTEAAFAAADTDSSDDLTVLEFLKWAAESKSAGGYVSNLRTFLTQVSNTQRFPTGARAPAHCSLPHPDGRRTTTTWSATPRARARGPRSGGRPRGPARGAHTPA